MPTNKNAQLRYKILDECFSDFNCEYEIDDLLEKVNSKLLDLYGTTVSLRQIRDDIKYMRERVTFDAPIVAYPYDGKRCYYRYEDPNFSIYKNDLSEEELSKLRSTIDMLGKYRGPEFAWLEEVISSLEYRFGVKPNGDNIVSFEQNGQLKGLEHLSSIIDATANRKPLELTYRTFGGAESKSIIYPYHVKQYNSRWFLFGLEESAYGRNITNRPLDRIVKFRALDKPFIPNEGIDFKSYFDDIIGVTIPKDHPSKESVVLKFDEKRFPYIVSKPIHHTQEIMNEKECIIRIQVRPNQELESVILSYGPQCEVIEPLWYRDQIKAKISDIYIKYFSVQNDCINGM